jgi:hypothetical protein
MPSELITSPVITMEPEAVPVTDDGDHERFAHIVKKDDQMMGYVMGEMVTALCGKKWVPSRDPEKYPVCPTCVEVWTMMKLGGGGDIDGAGGGGEGGGGSAD